MMIKDLHCWFVAQWANIRLIVWLWPRPRRVLGSDLSIDASDRLYCIVTRSRLETKCSELTAVTAILNIKGIRPGSGLKMRSSLTIFCPVRFTLTYQNLQNCG